MGSSWVHWAMHTSAKADAPQGFTARSGRRVRTVDDDRRVPRVRSASLTGTAGPAVRAASTRYSLIAMKLVTLTALSTLRVYRLDRPQRSRNPLRQLRQLWRRHLLRNDR